MRKQSVALMLPIALSLSGCAGMRLYSPERDKQGHAAQKAWAEVDVKSVIAIQRQNLAALLQEELRTQEALATARRDELIRAASTGATLCQSLLEPARTGLKRVAGSAALLDEWLKARKAAEKWAETMHDYELEFERAGFELPSCDDLADADKMKPVAEWIETSANTMLAKALGQAAAQAKVACTQRPAAASLLELKNDARFSALNFDDIALVRATEALRRQEAELESARKKNAAARNAFTAAFSEFDRALAESEVGVAAVPASEKLKQAAGKLSATTKRLAEADDLFSTAFLSEARLQTIDAVVRILAQEPKKEDTQPGTEATGSAKNEEAETAAKAASAAVLLAGAFDDWRQAQAQEQKTLILPLVLRKNYEQLKLEVMKREIGIQEALVTVERAQVEALTAQARQYKSALDLVSQPATPIEQPLQPLICKPVAQCKNIVALNFDLPVRRIDALTTAPGPNGRPPTGDSLECARDAQARIFQALGRYFDAEGRLRAEVRKADYRRNAILHERALALAEVNVLQWDALIRTSIDQSAAFAASGIKSEDASRLINSIMLFWIGLGVNN